MTDDEYKINEECRDGSCGSGKVSVVTAGLDEVLSALEDKIRKDEAERPSVKMRNISTVNYMFGKLRVAQEILNDTEGYNPRMEVYLGRDAREEFDDALSRAGRAVKKMLDLLYKEVKEQNKVLDVWKDEEEEE